jgi:hypothetical protein
VSCRSACTQRELSGIARLDLEDIEPDQRNAMPQRSIDDDRLIRQASPRFGVTLTSSQEGNGFKWTAGKSPFANRWKEVQD